MFAESTRVCFLIRNIVLYIYNEHTFVPHFSTFSFLYYTISIYRNENTLSRTYPFPPLSFRTFGYLYTLLLYTLYIERNILSRNFLPFSRSFLYFYYTPLIYRIGNTLSAPFYPSYKVNTLTPPPLSLLLL